MPEYLIKCRISISLALFAAIIFQISGSVLAQPQRRGLPAPKEVNLPKHDVELEMHRFRQLPMIELMINETGPYRMIVDTGAAGLVVTPELAKQLTLPSPPGMPAGMRVQVKTPGGDVPATLNYVDKIEIGDASFKGVWTIATSMPFGDGLDGIIGMNVFKTCLLTYDYPNNRIVLSQGELPDPNGTDVLSYTTPRMPDSHPVIQVSIDGKQENALVDTGMRGWFSIPRESVDDFNVLQGPAMAGMGMSVGQPIPNKVARLDAEFQIGGNRIQKPIVRLSDNFMVGTQFLDNFVVTFDGKNRRVRMSRKTNNPLIQPRLRDLGFGLKLKDDEMVIWYVHPQSDAAIKGFNVDDVVLELNAKPAKDAYDSTELLDAIQAEASIPVLYKPAKGGKAKTVNINVMEVLASTDNEKPEAPKRSSNVDPKTIKLGQAAFKQGMCAKCHGQDGTGTKRGPDLTDAQWDHCDGSAGGIRKVLETGVSKKELRDKSRPHAMNPATNLIRDKSKLSPLAQYVLSPEELASEGKT